MAGTQSYEGRCHCGSVHVGLALSASAEKMRVRSCQCGFCRPRGVVTVSDKDGEATITVRSEADITRYRFGLKTADYILCRTCGTYVGAIQDDDGQLISVINVGGLATPEFSDRRGEPVQYGNETASERRARRRAYWMPTRLVTTDAP